MASGVQGSISPSGFPMNRPGAGGMMPGMPGTRKMPGAPGMDNNDNWEVSRFRSMPRGDGRGQPPLIGKSPLLNQQVLPQGTGDVYIASRTSALLQGSGAPSAQPGNMSQVPVPHKQAPTPSPSSAPAARLSPDELKRKTISLLEEYFSGRLLDEALQCVEELKSPAYHPDFVKEVVSLGLEKSPPCVEPVADLLEYLFSKKVLGGNDIGSGFVLYAALLEDLAVDFPKAPANFVEILGKLVLAKGVDFEVVREVLARVSDDYYQKAIFSCAMKIVSSGSGGKEVLDSQTSRVAACDSLF